MVCYPLEKYFPMTPTPHLSEITTFEPPTPRNFQWSSVGGGGKDIYIIIVKNSYGLPKVWVGRGWVTSSVILS